MRNLATGIAAVLVLAGCGGESGNAEAAAPENATAVPQEAAAPAPAVSDPQIAEIVLAANDVDVAAGELARERGADARVREFGSRMVEDHTAVNQAAAELAGRLGVTPEATPTSQSLRDGGESSRSRLSGLSGADFDRAYMEGEVNYHQQVLDAIDQTLIPSAQNAELRTLLERTRPAIEAHLQHARDLQSALAGQ